MQAAARSTRSVREDPALGAGGAMIPERIRDSTRQKAAESTAA